jgi:predicted nucleic acid-binding protein
VQYLVLFEAIDVLPKLFARVIIPAAVARELNHPSTPERVRRWIAETPPWAELRSPATVSIHDSLGPGEVETISLAIEFQAQAVLLDDQKARIAATRLGLPVLGTLAVLEKAAEKNFLDFESGYRDASEHYISNQTAPFGGGSGAQCATTPLKPSGAKSI